MVGEASQVSAIQQQQPLQEEQGPETQRRGPQVRAAGLGASVLTGNAGL